MASNCWVWTAYKDRDGYGVFSIHIKDTRQSIPLRAYRVAYELFNSEIPTGLQIDHLCRNRACVNPDHMEAVTCKENINRGLTGYHNNRPNARKTHCKRGHELTLPNLNRAALKNGIRDCKLCAKIRQAEYKKKKTKGVLP